MAKIDKNVVSHKTQKYFSQMIEHKNGIRHKII